MILKVALQARPFYDHDSMIPGCQMGPGECVEKAVVRHGTSLPSPLFASQRLAALLQYLPRLHTCRHRHVHTSSKVKHPSGRQ